MLKTILIISIVSIPIFFIITILAKWNNTSHKYDECNYIYYTYKPLEKSIVIYFNDEKIIINDVENKEVADKIISGLLKPRNKKNKL